MLPVSISKKRIGSTHIYVESGTLARNAHISLLILLAWEFVTRSCLKPQNPCSNHEMRVLFEHDFYLKKPKLGPDLHA